MLRLRLAFEWLFALLAVLLIITCTLGSCVFYAGWCVYRVALWCYATMTRRYAPKLLA